MKGTDWGDLAVLQGCEGRYLVDALFSLPEMIVAEQRFQAVND